MEKSQTTLSIAEVIAQKGIYVGPTTGISMLPMLKNRRDTIVVKAKTQRLKALDVALYKRNNDYVLHRVIKPTQEGYIIRGDNCYADEYILEENVIGVLVEFYRKGKHVLCTDKKYLTYARRRVKNYKIRKFFVSIKNFMGAVLRKLHFKK